MDIPKSSKFLSGYELVHKGYTRQDTSLPEVGQKDVTPNGSWLEQKQTQAALDARKQIIGVERIVRNGGISHAEWRDDLKLAECTHRTGGHWKYLGHVIGGTWFLKPEEALFLMESNMLILYHNEVIVSIEKAYSILLDDEMSLTLYRVYSSLSRLGYKIYRHKEPAKENSRKRKSEDCLGNSAKVHKSFDRIEELNAFDLNDEEYSNFSGNVDMESFVQSPNAVIEKETVNNDDENVMEANREINDAVNEIKDDYAMTGYDSRMGYDEIEMRHETDSSNSADYSVDEVGVIRIVSDSEELQQVTFNSQPSSSNCRKLKEIVATRKEKRKIPTNSYQLKLQKLRNRKLKPVNQKIKDDSFNNIANIYNQSFVTINSPAFKLIPQNIFVNKSKYFLNLKRITKKKSSQPNVCLNEVQTNVGGIESSTENEVINTEIPQFNFQRFQPPQFRQPFCRPQVLNINYFPPFQTIIHRPFLPVFLAHRFRFHQFPTFFRPVLPNIQFQRQPNFEFLRQQNIEALRQQNIETLRQQNIEALRQQNIEDLRQQNIEFQRHQNIEFQRHQNIEAHRQQNIEFQRQQNIEFQRHQNIEAYRQQNIEAHRQQNIEAHRQQNIESHSQEIIESNRQQNVERYRQPNFERRRPNSQVKYSHLQAIKNLAMRVQTLSQMFRGIDGSSLNRLLAGYNAKYNESLRLTRDFEVINDNTPTEIIELDNEEENSSKKRRNDENCYDEHLNSIKILAGKLKELVDKNQCSSRHRRAISNLIKKFNKSFNADIYMDDDYNIIDKKYITLDSDSENETKKKGRKRKKKLRNPFNMLRRLNAEPSTGETISIDEDIEVISKEDPRYTLLKYLSKEWIPSNDDFGRPEVCTKQFSKAHIIETQLDEVLFDFLKNSKDTYNNWIDLKISFVTNLEASNLAHENRQIDILSKDFMMDIDSKYKPIIGPEDCKDMKTVLEKLRIIKTDKFELNDTSLRVHFDAYNRDVQNYSKKDPPTPHFRIICIDETSPFPSGSEISALHSRYDDKVPFVFAVVIHGSISYIRMNPYDLDVYLPNFDLL